MVVAVKKFLKARAIQSSRGLCFQTLPWEAAPEFIRRRQDYARLGRIAKTVPSGCLKLPDE